MNLLPALKDLAVSSISLLAEALLSSFVQVAPRGAPSCPHAAKPQKRAPGGVQAPSAPFPAP